LSKTTKILKGESAKLFTSVCFFHESNQPGPLIYDLKPFYYDIISARIFVFFKSSAYSALHVYELALKDTEQNVVIHCGPQHGIDFESDTIRNPCV
jgi:hypothetical protein